MKKGRVLIIEDERSVADALKMIMEDDGYEVTLACGVRCGLQEHAQGRFDLAVTDVNLPDGCGLEVLRSLRESSPLHPVIVITAHYTPEVVSVAKERGALAVLAKPFLPSDIINLIRQALDEIDHSSSR